MRRKKVGKKEGGRVGGLGKGQWSLLSIALSKSPAPHQVTEGRTCAQPPSPVSFLAFLPLCCCALSPHMKHFLLHMKHFLLQTSRYSPSTGSTCCLHAWLLPSFQNFHFLGKDLAPPLFKSVQRVVITHSTLLFSSPLISLCT